MLVQGILLAAMLGLSQQAGEAEILDKIGKKLEESGKLHRYARPIADQTQPIKVRTGLGLRNIMKFDQKSGVIQIHGNVLIEWKDEFLFTWNPEEYSGITSVNVHKYTDLWFPDLLQFNRRRPTMDVKYPRLEVSHDGVIRWIVIGSLETKCERDDHKTWCEDCHHYHHNLTATCNFDVGSWTYTSDLLKVESAFFGLLLLQPDDDWKVTSVSHVTKELKYPCCDKAFSKATFTLKINGQYDG